MQLQLHIIGLGASDTAQPNSVALQALQGANYEMGLGREGGSAAVVKTATCNALLRCNQGEWY